MSEETKEKLRQIALNMPEEQKEAAKQVIANSIEYIKFLNDNINPELS